MNIAAILALLDPYAGVVGIGTDGTVHGGYDETLDRACNDVDESWYDEEWIQEWRDDQLPPADRVAFADEMLRRWGEYRRRALQDTIGKDGDK